MSDAASQAYWGDKPCSKKARRPPAPGGPEWRTSPTFGRVEAAAPAKIAESVAEAAAPSTKRARAYRHTYDANPGVLRTPPDAQN